MYVGTITDLEDKILHIVTYRYLGMYIIMYYYEYVF